MPDRANCSFGIVQNPCGRETNQNWANTIKALQSLCRTLSTDPDDPTNNIFNDLLTRFRLTANLSQAGSAAAVKIVWNTTTDAWEDGDAITVYDDQTGGAWQGLVGYEGWARAVEDESSRHSIVWMQRIAYVVRGSITGSLSGGSATMTVTAYSDGVNPGASVAVYDTNGRFPDSVSGGVFTAYYDYENSRYEVVEGEQSEWIAEAVASQNYNPTTSSVSISSVTFKTFQEYMPNPTTPTTARNRYGLYGTSGDIILIHKSKATGEWEIVTGGAPGSSSTAPAPVHRFRLTGNLQIGGPTTAQRLFFDGTTYSEVEAIVVFDRPYGATGGSPGGTRGMWSGIASMEGWARKREANELGGNDEYEIVWMEQFGRFILGTLTTNIGATNPQEATARVDYMFGQGDGLTTSTFTVHDDHDWFHFAKEGAKFLAIRNEYLGTSTPGTPYYTLAVCQQQVLYGKAQLQDDVICPADETATVTQFRGWTPSLFNQQLPEGQPTTALNTFALAALNGDALFLTADYFTDPADVKWHILQAEHHNVLMVTQIRFNDSNKCLEYKDASIAVMLCEEESDWKPLLCGEVCQNP